MNRMIIGKMPEMDYFVQSAVDRLRVNIGFIGAEKKVLMFSSSEPSEGKSYISTNIWIELAKAGKRVCLVDADMRKSVLRGELNLRLEDKDEFLGLTHYLAGTNLNDVIYSTNIANAFIIPTVTIDNPSLLLESDRFDRMLDVLRDHFDYVIIDTPPLRLISDGQLIAKKCDGCIFVVRAHSTSRSMVRECLNHLERAGCPLLGVVLNQVEASKGGRYYKKTYYKKYSGSPGV